MTKLKIFSTSLVDGMRERVTEDPNIAEIYRDNAQYPLKDDAKFLDTIIELPESDPELVVTGARSEDEAENAIKVYEYLSGIDRTQAADPRLWATLTHTVFWEYTRARWPSLDQGALYILEHWFEKKGGGLGALRRNAISRLWWAAHLTVAPWEKDQELGYLSSSDRYKFTRVLLSQAQVFQDVLEREFGSDLRIRTLLLSALDKFLPSVTNRDNLSKASSTELLLVLKNRHVEALSLEEAAELVDTLVSRAAQKQLAA